jgi:putative colanic acid biosynthesis acetyltransferase WcaF
MAELDIQANRKAVKYTPAKQALRVLWGLAGVLFRLSPRPAWGWRNALLRLFGARLGRDVRIDPTARIYMPWNLVVGDEVGIGFDVLLYNLGAITIGRQATVSHRAHLCAGTHDYRDPALPLLKPPIEIGARAWICADAFVGPGVRVGEGAVVGARAVVVDDVPAWTVVAGNPAQPVGRRQLRETPAASGAQDAP